MPPPATAEVTGADAAPCKKALAFISPAHGRIEAATPECADEADARAAIMMTMDAVAASRSMRLSRFIYADTTHNVASSPLLIDAIAAAIIITYGWRCIYIAAPMWPRLPPTTDGRRRPITAHLSRRFIGASGARRRLRSCRQYRRASLPTT